MNIAKTPQPPYYAVIFTSKVNSDLNGYEQMATKILELAKEQEGFLGFESAREEIGIAISYWKDLNSIKKWKEDLDHIQAQKLGREKWYSNYYTRISKVERDYSF